MNVGHFKMPNMSNFTYLERLSLWSKFNVYTSSTEIHSFNIEAHRVLASVALALLFFSLLKVGAPLKLFSSLDSALQLLFLGRAPEALTSWDMVPLQLLLLRRAPEALTS